MELGAFALMDCLGFKGIWNRVDAARVIGRLQQLEQVAAAEVLPQYSMSGLSFGPIRLRVRLLSDTVALSVQYEPTTSSAPSDRQLNLLVGVACQAAGVISRLFIDDEVPLALRGTVSFGAHLCDGAFLIGPAVDEAAEYMNTPQGAFVWVLPSAAERHTSFVNRARALGQTAPPDVLLEAFKILAEAGVNSARAMVEMAATDFPRFVAAYRETHDHIVRLPVVVEGYPLPLRDGGVIDATIVNPLFWNDAEVRQRIIRRYSGALEGGRLDVWQKKQHTMRFLQHADGLTRSALAPLASAERSAEQSVGDVAFPSEE